MQQRRKRASQPQYAGDWDRISREFRRSWIERHGPLCPGYDRDPHLVQVTDLVTDHVAARDRSRLQVLCRSCNSTKGNHERRGGRGA